MRLANQPDALPRSTRTAFTLVELMVTVGIIALLVTLLLPAISSVRNQAKVADTNALLATLTQGNEVFRGNQQIGGSFIPSSTDSFAKMGIPGVMADPTQPQGNSINVLPLSGASLLAYGLAGADGQGTPGFKDLNRIDGWWDDQHTKNTTPIGAYALDPTTFEALQPRQGPFVSDNALNRMVTFARLIDDSIMIPGSRPLNAQELRQKVFQDAWGRPVLYYRARRSANNMVHDFSGSEPPGVYDLADNRRITGANGLKNMSATIGLDFGAGTQHPLNNTTFPSPDPATDDLSLPASIGTFERYIWDSQVTNKNVPVNRDTFLLISTGKDALYGTQQDVANWARQ